MKNQRAILAVFSLFVALSAGTASAQRRELNPTGGTTDPATGLRINMGETGQIQIHRAGTGQVYAPGSLPPSTDMYNGIFLAVGPSGSATVYGPASTAATASVDTVWTAGGQTPVTGSGTRADPWTSTTTLTGGGFTVRWTVTYTLPDDEMLIDLEVTPPAGNTQQVRLYHAIDTFLAGSDAGPAYIRPSAADPAVVGVRRLDVFEAFIRVADPWDFFFSGLYSQLLATEFDNGRDLGNVEDTSDTTDNGIGVEWSLGVLTAPRTLRYRLSFTDQFCSVGMGTLDSGCIASRPACNPASLTCVECTADRYCATGVCDVARSTCQPCLDSAAPGVADTGCGSATRICDTSGATNVCVECVETADCAGGAICDAALHVCVASPTACGDGRVDAGEACDDGDLLAGDGCSPTCAIEGGFDCSCATPTITYSMETLAGRIGGDGGGTGPQMGCGSNDVLIGLAFLWSDSRSEAVGTRAICGAVAVGATGEVTTTRTTGEESGGSGCGGWTPASWSPEALCPSGSAVVGIRGMPSTLSGTPTLFTDATIVCQAMTVDGTPVGPTTDVHVTGGGTPGSSQVVDCPAGTIARYFRTRAGCAQDALDLYCGQPAATCAGQPSICQTPCGAPCPAGRTCDLTTRTCMELVCGNGVLNTGEVCDDGNLVDADACSNACLLGPTSPCTDAAECALGRCATTCEGCADSTVGGTDLGCTTGLPACVTVDVAFPTCAECTVDADCAVGRTCDALAHACVAIPDGGMPDAGTPDAGTPDAGAPDAGAPDAGTPTDGGTTMDAGPRFGGAAGGACAVSTSSRSAPQPMFAVGALAALGLLAARARRRKRVSRAASR